jgi:thiamine-phosphate pyrophosphorylase
MVITDTTVAPEGALERRIQDLLARARAGEIIVQLRDRDLPVRVRLRIGERLVRACRAYGHRLIVNDRVDLAVLLGADGVHLPERGIPPERARALLGNNAWISVAAHDACGAPPPGVSAIVLSPIVAERKGRPPLGVAALSAMASSLKRAVDPPVALYALGGIDAESAAGCLEHGADGVAVIGAALDGRDVRPLLKALDIRRD